MIARGCPRCGLEEGHLLLPDGRIVDNRDGFYDDPTVPGNAPEHQLVQVPRKRLQQLLEAERKLAAQKLEPGDFERDHASEEQAA